MTAGDSPQKRAVENVGDNKGQKIGIVIVCGTQKTYKECCKYMRHSACGMLTALLSLGFCGQTKLFLLNFPLKICEFVI